MLTIDPDDALAVAAVEAIRSGDLEALQCLLRDNPSLAIARIGKSRTLLHVATDWPGNFPNSASTVAALVASGAEVNARFTGAHTETPLHWAASCGDVAALDALLDHGADIEALGAVIGGGAPLADAVAFGQWQPAPSGRARGADNSLAGRRIRADDSDRAAFRKPPRAHAGRSYQCFLVCVPRWAAGFGAISSRPRRGPELDWP
jgi:uncharacterized protein